MLGLYLRWCVLRVVGAVGGGDDEDPHDHHYRHGCMNRGGETKVLTCASSVRLLKLGRCLGWLACLPVCLRDACGCWRLQESASASPGELTALNFSSPVVDEGGAGEASAGEPQLQEAASQLSRIVEERLQALVRSRHTSTTAIDTSG